MKNFYVILLALLVVRNLTAQQIGDTIVIKAFKYGSTTRDTLINFPNTAGQTFEKIIMKYNMRCKNGLISNQSLPNQGCGEWDYSCNTYIVDSTKIENALFTAPNYIVSNFNGTVFPYRSAPIFDYYNFSQTNVTLNNIVSETQYTVGNGTTAAPNVITSNQRSGRTQLLYTAAELTAAGITAGNIDGFLLNVANAGGGANFFKVGIQQTTQSVLNATTVTASGFTTVFNSNRTFTTGINRVQFYAPFVWNGTSNLLVDISFTNTNPTNPVVLNGAATASNMVLYTNNNYALNLAALGRVILAANNLGSINNEITVSFWAYGNAGLLPANTVLLYGYGSNSNQRHLNLHLPWSDSRMYFDCGYSAGGFDRIDKASTAAEQGGQWNHWAFTKNAVTGNMRIYLNGALWHSGTGNTKPMSILNLILGSDQNSNSNWKGKINEFTLWNTELSASNIATWMNKAITPQHPFYANLLAYYKMNEGSGLIINEAVNNLTATGTNLQWTYDRGHTLTRGFTETNIRPNIVFLRGTYALSTTTVAVMDSVQRNPNMVQQYTVVSNATVTPPTDDLVNLVSTNSYYQTSPIQIYNGDTGVLTGTQAVTSASTITISNMNYFRRFPFYNEIMSFVTPYGKGLDMGIKGKSWFFDVSDYAPILRGPKRFLMTLGGENQEQMDIDFWFIVGTPPRTVNQFNQLWQGAARAGDASIGTIVNNTRFPSLNVPIPSNSQAFKMRSTITGHGQHGEFKVNGGTVNHFLNFNGGANEFTWQLTQECAGNVIFPQGGTWVYDREGWCPGEASLLKEYDVTPHVTAGSTALIDYGCSNPPNANGDYRYIVANQLISYGAANFNLDARITDVMKPSNKVLYSRENPVCGSPVIVIQNSGSTPITSVEINYWVNNAAAPETHTWTGNLAFMQQDTVTLPIANLWMGGTQTNGNRFYAEIKKVNQASDQYSYNNKYVSDFSPAATITNSFTIEFKTNNNYLENSYVLYDDAGNNVGASNFTAANTLYTDYYQLDGCFTLKVEDLGNDGLSWWASTGQGSGYARIKNANGVAKSFQADFGKGFEYSFSTFNPLSVNKYQSALRLNVYPNPAKNKFVVSGDELLDAKIALSDVLGRTVELPFNYINSGSIEFDSSSLTSGVYMLTISRGTQRSVKKVIVE